MPSVLSGTLREPPPAYRMVAMAQQGELVSIGLPVRNGAEFLEAAVSTLLAQTHERLEIVLADNGSTDATGEIAVRLAAADSRVRYHRHPSDVGAVENFRFVLEQSRGDFFMWAGADDSWDPTFIEANLGQLRQNEELVASVSLVQWRRTEAVAGGDVLAPGTFALTGTVSANISRYLKHARDNSRFYGLYRRAALLESFPNRGFYALDLAIMVGTLRFGGHAEVPEVLMTRGRNDPAGYIHSVDHVNRPGVERWLPMLPCTRYLLRDLDVPMAPRSYALLLVRNVYEHVRYAALRDSLYGGVARMLLRFGDPLRRRSVGG